MVDVFQVAAQFVEHVKKTYADDVALIAYYGSYARGTASATSDLDVYYIPDDGKAQDLYRSFVFNDLPFEFWPVSWEFAEKIASGRHSWSVAPAMLWDAQMLYVRSDTDLSRFNALKTGIADLQTPDRKGHMVKLAVELFPAAAIHMENLRLSCRCHDLPGARSTGFNLVTTLVDCLALVNQVFWPKFWTACPQQIFTLPIRPEHLEPCVTTICTSSEFPAIQYAAERLLHDSRELLVREYQRCYAPAKVTEKFNGYYPAIQEYVNKVRSACAKRNLIEISYWATKMQQELSEMLAHVHTGFENSLLHIYAEYRHDFDQQHFPDLAQAVAKSDFGDIVEQTQRFAARVQAYLTQHSVSLRTMQSVEQLQTFMEQPW